MEGYDVEDEVYGTTLLDTGVTEWFDIVKSSPVKGIRSMKS